MSRFVAGRNTVTVTPGAKVVTAGRFYLIEGFFGLAVQDTDPTNGLHRLQVNLNCEPGVYEVSTNQVTVADAFNTRGADVYFDAATERFTTVAATNRKVGRVDVVKDAGGVIWVSIIGANN